MALALDTLLPTPYGWTLVADLKPDSILFDELGYPCAIKSLSEPYLADCHEVKSGWAAKQKHENSPIVCSSDQEFMTFTFERMRRMGEKDRSVPKTAYVSQPFVDIPENWPVWTRAEIPRASKKVCSAKPIARTYTAAQIQETVTYYRSPAIRRNHAIPITFGLSLKARDLKIPPYILGLCISLSDREANFKFSQETFAYYTKQFESYGYSIEADQKQFNHVRHKIIRGSVPSLKRPLKEMGFNHTIPPEYLRGSVKQRMDLLEGLLDQHTPKFYHEKKKSVLCYRTRNSALANQVQDLVRGLGYPAYTKHVTSDVGANTYYVCWHARVIPFRMPKLRTSYAYLSDRAGKPIERYIWKIFASDPVPEQQLVRDIEVNSPYGLYSVSELYLPVKGDS